MVHIEYFFKKLIDCSHCLSYMSQSVNSLADAEMPVAAYRGLQSLIECIQLALDYEFYRMRDQKPEKS